MVSRSALALILVLCLSLVAPAAGSASGAFSWTPVSGFDDRPPYANPTRLIAVSCATTSLCATVDGSGKIFSSTDPTGDFTAWMRVAVGSGVGLSAISCPSASLCVAVGGGQVVSSTDPGDRYASWRVTAIPDGGLLGGISCASASLCVATAGPSVLVSSNPASGPGSWKSQEIDSRSTLTGISCPTTALCVAVDRGGDLLTSTDPTGGTVTWQRGHLTDAHTLAGTGFSSVACASASLCLAGDLGGNLWSSTSPDSGARSWSSAYIDSSNMQCGYEPGKYTQPIYCQASIAGLTCASPSACLAVDGAGLEFTSGDPAGGASAWRQTGRAPSPDVSCPSTSLCAAPGNGSVYSSTNAFAPSPTWSQTAAFDGTPGLSAASCSASVCAVADSSGHVLTSPAPASSPWASSYTGVSSIDSLSCPSADFCAGVSFWGQVLVSSDPSSSQPLWSSYAIALPGAVAISCPSPALCVAVNFQGQVATSTDPAGGATTWTIRKISVGRPNGLSCPSVRLCVMTINVGDGELAVTRNPTGPASSWMMRRVDTALDKYSHAPAAMIAVACATTQLCVASDNTGHLVASTDPASPKAHWVQTRPNQGYVVEGLTCPQVNLCVAYSALQILTSIDPTGPEPWQVTQVARSAMNDWLQGMACSSAHSCVGIGGPNLWAGTRAPRPTASQTRSALRAALDPHSLARDARTLLRAGKFLFALPAPGPGTLHMTWTVVTRRVAAGLIVVPGAGTSRMRVKLTASGKKTLSRHGVERIRVTVSYAPPGSATRVSAARTFRLHG